MTWFQVRQFVKVSYFVQLMVVSTLTVVVTQALAWRAWGGNPQVMWVRGGIIGMWTVTTCAAGILGFERRKGTFVYLMAGRLDPRRSMFSVISATSTFGLAAIPLAWVTWAICTGTTGFVETVTVALVTRYCVAVLLLWLACLTVACVISTVFILTPNAIQYESLLLTPVLIASGLLFTDTAMPRWLEAISLAIPIRWPIRILLGVAHGTDVYTDAVAGLVISVLWLLVAWRLGEAVMNRASRTATLEVI